MGYRVVVVGATGNVGREMLNILAERQFPIDEIAAVASPRSTGDVIDFGDSGQELRVKNIEHFDFAGWEKYPPLDVPLTSLASSRSTARQLHLDCFPSPSRANSSR